MEASAEYRTFAAECRRMVELVSAERHRAMLEEMAAAWDRLADKASNTSRRP